MALLGSYGAGKTTAVSIVLGQRRPNSGSDMLFGRDPTIPAARRSVGATPQETGFPDNLRVREVVDWIVSLKGEEEIRWEIERRPRANQEERSQRTLGKEDHAERQRGADPEGPRGVLTG